MKKYFHPVLNDLAISVMIMMLLLGAAYMYGNSSGVGDGYNNTLEFLDGVGDFFFLPLYPGIYLYYPPAGVVVLLVALYFCAKIKRRKTRLPLIFGILLSWMWLGLLTSVEYYPCINSVTIPSESSALCRRI